MKWAVVGKIRLKRYFGSFNTGGCRLKNKVMAGIKGNKKHANKTSFPNQKNWGNKKHPAVVLRKLSQMIENTRKMIQYYVTKMLVFQLVGVVLR